MKPGEIITLNGSITLNEGREGCSIMVSNTGDRPIQVGSHFIFLKLTKLFLSTGKVREECGWISPLGQLFDLSLVNLEK